jgi:tetratricopeptide (TPR) repeat protein
MSGSVISQRALILSQIIRGLAYYATDHYSIAQSFFQQAADNPTWWSSDGKEFIYLMIGNTYQRQSACNMDPAYLPMALDAYTKALDINPSFLRVRAGWASTMYLQSLQDFSKLPDQCPTPGLYKEIVDRERLITAQQAFESMLKDSLASTNDQNNIHVIIPKLHSGLGSIYLTRYMTDGDEQWLKKARTSFLDAIKLGGDNPDANYHVGYSYAMLATLDHCDQNIEQAIENYEQAAGRLSPAYNALYYAELGELFCYKNELDVAVKFYKQAVAECGMASQNECSLFFKDCDQYNTRWKQLRQLKAENANTCISE